jgi:hypothetical protein
MTLACWTSLWNNYPKKEQLLKNCLFLNSLALAHCFIQVSLLFHLFSWWKHIKGWSLGFNDFNRYSLAPKHIIYNFGPNNEPKKMLKFLIICPKIFWPKYGVKYEVGLSMVNYPHSHGPIFNIELNVKWKLA